MADRFVWIDVENEDQVILALTRYEEKIKQDSIDMLDDIGDFVVLNLLGIVPVHESYLARHIGRTSVHFTPGGAGGGGSQQVIAGIRRGTSMHPFYVELGTGIYAGRGLIHPRHDRAPATVLATGRPRRMGTDPRAAMAFGTPRRFRRFVRGQRGQHYFFRTWERTRMYAQARVLENHI